MTFGTQGGFIRLFAHPWSPPEDLYDEETRRALQTFHHLNNLMRNLAVEACMKEWKVLALNLLSVHHPQEPPQEVLDCLNFNLILVNYSDLETVSANVQ